MVLEGGEERGQLRQRRLLRCLSRATADTYAANSHLSANGATFLSPAHSVRFQAVPKRQRRDIPQPNPTGWVTGAPHA